MNTVLTAAQAKQLAVRKTTFKIVPYETAVKALRECLEYDEIKHWDNYADIAAAWAKIHRDDAVVRLGKAIKLHAYRRMGEWARKARPPQKCYTSPGGGALLRELGMSRTDSNAAMRLSLAPEKEVAEAAAREKPPSPLTLARRLRGNRWSDAALAVGWSNFRSGTQRVKPEVAARAAVEAHGGVAHVREQALGMKEWLEKFIASLPKQAR